MQQRSASVQIESRVLVNWLLCGDVRLQVELEGVTGHVAFDDHGHRRDFQLSVSELNLNTEPRPVLYAVILIVTRSTTSMLFHSVRLATNIVICAIYSHGLITKVVGIVLLTYG